MDGKFYVGKRAKSITLGLRQNPITKVILNGDDDLVYEAGVEVEDGSVLETYVPSATQQMANDILQKVRGFEYQGYTADTAFIKPTIELGDGVTIGGIYTMIANREVAFTPKMSENISAPFEDEANHEYDYQGTYSQEINNRVKLGQQYYGTRISRKKGLEIVRTDGENEYTRVILNSDQLIFKTADGSDAFYYDQNEGRFIINNRVNIEDALDASEKFSSLVFDTEKLQVDLVNEIEERKTSIKATADGLNLRIDDEVFGLNNTITITANGLQGQISDNADNITSVTATANGLSTQVNGPNGLSSQLSQLKDSITLSVTNGETSSTISLSADGIETTSVNIKFNGMVTFDDLAGTGERVTVIDGDNITTGSILADYLTLKGLFTVTDEDGDIGGFLGYGQGKSGRKITEGLVMLDSSGEFAAMATTDGAKLSYGSLRNPENQIYVTNKRAVMDADGTLLDVSSGLIAATEEISSYSDRRFKNSIDYNLETYKELLMNLRPAKYKFNFAKNDVYHTGFIAQDVEQAMSDLGLRLDDFGGIAYNYEADRYYLRYGEFIALLVAVIQEQEKRIIGLERRSDYDE